MSMQIDALIEDVVAIKRQGTIPLRQIRASYDERTITVYQAYPASIAIPAVKLQKIHASPGFLFSRMTWIKPSWCWMMYRSGYSTKDARQSHILAIKMKHENFRYLLSLSSVAKGRSRLTSEEKSRPVRVQWDPERSPRSGRLENRSIQIGISRSLAEKWAEELIESIDDVTDVAKELMQVLFEEKNIGLNELADRGLIPVEREYGLPDELRHVLDMDP